MTLYLLISIVASFAICYTCWEKILEKADEEIPDALVFFTAYFGETGCTIALMTTLFFVQIFTWPLVVIAIIKGIMKGEN